KVGPTTPVRFEGRIRELVAGHPSLEAIAESLLAVRVALRREFERFEKQLRAMARCETRARLLTSVPGVGAIVSLTFAAAPTPGRWIRSDRMSARGTRPRFHRLVDLSSQTPLGGGQRADPVQKHDPGERISRE